MTMDMRHVRRKIERTPEQLAELRAARERFQRERPAPAELSASGEFEGPFNHGEILELLTAVATIKAERLRLKLSLADIAERSGLDKAFLSRLENGKVLNPTLSTLWRYADAVGMRVSLGASPNPRQLTGV
jgi:DNA-binding Xre family transcriptional regulator